MRIVLLALGVAALVVAGCKSPDAESGDDARRDQAAQIPLDEWIHDDNGVDFRRYDRTDWKKFEIPGAGTLYLDVRVEAKDAELVITLFDRFGRQLIEKVKKRGEQEPVRIVGPVGKGRYFVRIQAKDGGDASLYYIRASMTGAGGGGGHIPPPE